MPLQRHAWPYRNRILSAFFVLSLKRNNTTNENNNSNNDFEKKEKGKKEKGEKRREEEEKVHGVHERTSLDPASTQNMYMCASEETNVHSRETANSSLTPGYSIFAGMRKKLLTRFIRTDQPSYAAPSIFPCAIVEWSMKKTKRSRIRAATHAATLLRTRIVPIEIALVHTAVCTTSMFIYLPFTPFLSLLFLPLS